MTEILAGLVGGLLALAGGFGIQLLAGRQGIRARRTAIAAAFLADAGALSSAAIKLHAAVQLEGAGRPVRETLDLLESAMDTLRRSGYELALLAQEHRQPITALMSECEDLLLLSIEHTAEGEPNEFGDQSRRVRGLTDQLAADLRP